MSYLKNDVPVAVPEKIFGLTLSLDFFDRCHSLSSLHLPPAALASLPLRQKSKIFATSLSEGGKDTVQSPADSEKPMEIATTSLRTGLAMTWL